MTSATAHRSASNFLTGEELDRGDLVTLLDRAEELKRGRERGDGRDSLAGRSRWMPRRRRASLRIVPSTRNPSRNVFRLLWPWMRSAS